MIDNDPNHPDAPLDRLIEALAGQVEATARMLDRLESRAFPLLERIAVALERSATAQVPVTARGLPDFRLALREHRWDDADAIVAELLATRPEDPSNLGLAVEVEEAHQAAAAEARDRIEAARLANDADGVLSIHAELTRVSPIGSLKAYDAGLVKWLMTLIHKRLRGGVIRPDLAELAGRVADRFGATPEGASLKASLPTLRRSAGLCPRCADPYNGLADACPKCLGAAFEEPPPIELPPATLPVDEEDEPERVTGPFDLNDAQLWQNP